MGYRCSPWRNWSARPSCAALRQQRAGQPDGQAVGDQPHHTVATAETARHGSCRRLSGLRHAGTAKLQAPPGRACIDGLPSVAEAHLSQLPEGVQRRPGILSPRASRISLSPGASGMVSRVGLRGLTSLSPFCSFSSAEKGLRAATSRAAGRTCRPWGFSTTTSPSAASHRRAQGLPRRPPALSYPPASLVSGPRAPSASATPRPASGRIRPPPRRPGSLDQGRGQSRTRGAQLRGQRSRAVSALGRALPRSISTSTPLPSSASSIALITRDGVGTYGVIGVIDPGRQQQFRRAAELVGQGFQSGRQQGAGWRPLRCRSCHNLALSRRAVSSSRVEVAPASLMALCCARRDSWRAQACIWMVASVPAAAARPLHVQRLGQQRPCCSACCRGGQRRPPGVAHGLVTGFGATAGDDPLPLRRPASCRGWPRVGLWQASLLAAARMKVPLQGAAGA